MCSPWQRRVDRDSELLRRSYEVVITKLSMARLTTHPEFNTKLTYRSTTTAFDVVDVATRLERGPDVREDRDHRHTKEVTLPKSAACKKC